MGETAGTRQTARGSLPSPQGTHWAKADLPVALQFTLNLEKDIIAMLQMWALLLAMGVCASGELSEQEKAEQERQAAAEQRRLVVEASEPVRLLSTSPEFELPAHEANTVLEVLEIRAEQMGLPKAAAASLEMEFSGAFISHEKTLKEAGLCDQAEISVQGEAKAKAAWMEQL